MYRPGFLVSIVILLLLVVRSDGFCTRFSKFRLTQQLQSDLERELDLFFEQSSDSGSAVIRQLTPQQRAERAIIGSQIEDKIFVLRDKLMNLENEGMKNGNVNIEEIKDIRSKIEKLKEEYTEIVGAKDLPMYFGRVPDSFQ